MKRIFLFLLCCTLLFSATTVATSANDNSDIALCNNNTMVTRSSFYIDANGEASIMVSYYGYSNITTGAVISTKLQKQSGTDWIDVEDWTETPSSVTYRNTYTLQLTERGTYRTIIDYRISGTGGPDDIFNEELEYTY